MSTLLTLFVVQLVALITPGPDSLLVARTAAGTSRRAALAVVLGLVLGNAFWAGLALGGLQLVFERVVWLQLLVKLIGGAYLLYLGLQMWRASLARRRDDADPALSVSVPTSAVSAFRTGLLTNLANVKVLVYFSSVFVTFITPSTTTGLKVAMLAMVLLEAAAVFGLVALVLSLPRPQRWYRRAGAWIDRTAGTVFAAFGLRLLLTANRAH